MQCPNCLFDHEDQTTECLKCGLVFAKFFNRQEIACPTGGSTFVDGGLKAPQSLQEAKEELRCRLLAFPLALLTAGLLVKVSGGLVRIFLSMWVHETGHAATAWLCGFGAFPGPWFTPVSNTRMPQVTVAVTAAFCFGIFHSWRAGRTALVIGGVAALVIQLICTTLPVDEANALVIFGGDAGCLVLGSFLMATFYAPRDNALYRGALRWGFLGIGAAAFMDASLAWWGARSDPGIIPFGENGVGCLSDPSRLTEECGWTMQTMVDRYNWLGVVCLVFLAALYMAGIVQARSAVRMKERAVSFTAEALPRKED